MKPNIIARTGKYARRATSKAKIAGREDSSSSIITIGRMVASNARYLNLPPGNS